MCPEITQENLSDILCCIKPTPEPTCYSLKWTSNNTENPCEKIVMHSHCSSNLCLPIHTNTIISLWITFHNNNKKKLAEHQLHVDRSMLSANYLKGKPGSLILAPGFMLECYTEVEEEPVLITGTVHQDDISS